MNPEKVGKFIKELRKKNNLTQKDLADKYGVTYQAVSKWENGINLPEISLIRQMSKDFNISVENILDGEESNDNPNSYKKRPIKFILLLLALLAIIGMNVYLILNKDNLQLVRNLKLRVLLHMIVLNHLLIYQRLITVVGMIKLVMILLNVSYMRTMVMRILL